jgi:hypothetical protein
MDKIGYVLLGAAVIVWLLLILTAVINALPEGLLGLLIIGGFGFLLAKAIADRVKNKEDDYYSKNIKR